MSEGASKRTPGPGSGRSRFAPTTSGRAHPGTLVAALLCWLDARARGGEVRLRLEDLDRERTKEGYAEGLEADLDWFGLDWDGCDRQSSAAAYHEEVIAELVAEGRVYACDCSRARVRQANRRAPDGSFAYPGTCRSNRVGGDWRSEARPLRLELPGEQVQLRDESGADLSGDAAVLFGDPILRRRDGVTSYHLASVLDDAALEVARVVRGRDLAPSTLLQVALQRALDLPTPIYRHHALLLERRGEKLSKLHGAVDVPVLQRLYGPEELCGLLAGFVGIGDGGRCAPRDLVSGFDWSRVRDEDVLIEWDPEDGLRVGRRDEDGGGEP